MQPTNISLAAVGDFLIHMPIVQAARDNANGTYDFSPMFGRVSEYLSAPDFTIGNLETRLAGPEKGYSGYPLFNSPESLAKDLKELGVDLITTANNHSLDMGVKGIVTTNENLEKEGLVHIGTYRSPEERNTPFVREVKGVKLGFINYTQDTNGIPVPQDKSYIVNVIEREKINLDLKALREQRVDLIIACIHFGTEYQRYPNEFQKTVVRELFEQGVDVVLGDHVHVIQPMEIVKINRDGVEKNCFVIYSLGNFISNQRWRFSDCGVVLNIHVQKNWHSGQTCLTGVDYVPVWVHTYRASDKLHYRVLPVEDAINDYIEGKDSFLTAADYNRLRQVWEDTTNLLGPPIKL